DDVFSPARVPMRETPFTKWTKAKGRKHLAPRLRVISRGIALVGVKDRPQSSDPRHAFVTNIPDQPENAAYLQDPSNLPKSARIAKPVKRLRADNGIDGGIRKWNVFRRPLLCFNSRIELHQLRQHCGNRFNGNNGGLCAT